jgi:hypothetical protein
MEDVLAVYALPYDANYPVVCMDETCKQLVGEVNEPIPCAPGRPERIDPEYVRNGVAEVFLEVEPLTGRRHVAATAHRAARDWAEWIQGMVDERYPDAIRIRLVVDNLSTHSMAALYSRFEPTVARRLAERLEIHYTPKHGSWLNMAEIELSALVTQCLDQRIPDLETMQRHICAWETRRNNRRVNINWHFTTDDARTKLLHLYPKL